MLVFPAERNVSGGSNERGLIRSATATGRGGRGWLESLCFPFYTGNLQWSSMDVSRTYDRSPTPEKPFPLSSEARKREMEIVHYPHPSLRWKSQPVRKIDAELKSTIRQMFELMYENKGIGLAANQVALPIRVFVMNPTGDAQENDQEMVFINPEILRKRGTVEGEEGCLSLPDVYGQVRRSEEILVSAFDLAGKEFRVELDDLLSRIVQHESDHLDGVMFFDRMDDDERSKIEARIADFEFEFRKGQKEGDIPPDRELKRLLTELQP